MGICKFYLSQLHLCSVKSFKSNKAWYTKHKIFTVWKERRKKCLYTVVKLAPLFPSSVWLDGGRSGGVWPSHPQWTMTEDRFQQKGASPQPSHSSWLFVAFLFYFFHEEKGRRTGHVRVLKTPLPSAPFPQQQHEEVQFTFFLFFLFCRRKRAEKERMLFKLIILHRKFAAFRQRPGGPFSAERILYCPQISVG